MSWRKSHGCLWRSAPRRGPLIEFKAKISADSDVDACAKAGCGYIAFAGVHCDHGSFGDGDGEG